MAFGGGGFAISYPLARALEKMQDRCIQRYPGLFASDDRMQACMAELGVPLTKELGFHQVCISAFFVCVFGFLLLFCVFCALFLVFGSSRSLGFPLTEENIDKRIFAGDARMETSQE